MVHPSRSGMLGGDGGVGRGSPLCCRQRGQSKRISCPPDLGFPFQLMGPVGTLQGVGVSALHSYPAKDAGPLALLILSPQALALPPSNMLGTFSCPLLPLLCL